MASLLRQLLCVAEAEGESCARTAAPGTVSYLKVRQEPNRVGLVVKLRVSDLSLLLSFFAFHSCLALVVCVAVQ